VKPRTYIFWILLVAFLVYEAYALATPAYGDTISEITWGLLRHPIVPFVVGVVCGHFFWQNATSGE